MGGACSNLVFSKEECHRQVTLQELRMIYVRQCKKAPYEEVARILDCRPVSVNFFFDLSESRAKIHLFKKEWIVPDAWILSLSEYCQTELAADSSSATVLAKTIIGLDAQQTEYFFPPDAA
jgi:hypothetical protein